MTRQRTRLALPASALAGSLLLAAPAAVLAQPAASDTSVRVTFGGFVDAYYAYDAGRPPTLDRSFAGGATFTTQPARHAEFNVNLAYVEAVLTGPRLRGRLALQAGTAVQSNYAAEPTNGTVSGASLARHLQEAYAGYQLAPSLWVDGGIFYSHMGMESWASKDNPTYTRSLVAEYSPYYSSGVRAIWQATPRLTAHLHVVNGWQNVSETNTGKGAGLRLDLAATPSTTLSYYNFFNEEVGGRLRVFNGIGAKLVASRTTLLGQVDVGSLEAADDGDASTWYGLTLIASQRLASTVAVVGRYERYEDEDQVNIATGLDDPFRGDGVSLGLDVTPHARLLWRTEARGFFADAPVFPDGASAPRRSGAFVVSALTLAF
jgi:hypothetical protein